MASISYSSGETTISAALYADTHLAVADDSFTRYGSRVTVCLGRVRVDKKMWKDNGLIERPRAFFQLVDRTIATADSQSCCVAAFIRRRLSSIAAETGNNGVEPRTNVYVYRLQTNRGL